MDNLIFIIGAFYCATALYIWYGLLKKTPASSQPPLESGSLVICARNEENNLAACLESVENQTIDPNHLELILVDDASDDKTFEIMEEYASRSRFSVQVLHMQPAAEGEMAGKWRALNAGIKLAKGEALLMTDADAILSTTWAERHLEECGKCETAAGFASITGDESWHRIQNLEWLFIQAAGSSQANVGKPQSALGKNMSIRRSAYDSVGGYERIGFSLTEDLALIQAVSRIGGRQSFPCADDMMVSTSAVSNWKEFIQQRKRWSYGVRHLSFRGRILILLMTLRNLAVIFGFIFNISGGIWVWTITAIANYLILNRVTFDLGQSFKLKSFLYWEIFQTWTSPVQVWYVLANREIHWKSRTHKV